MGVGRGSATKRSELTRSRALILDEVSTESGPPRTEPDAAEASRVRLARPGDARAIRDLYARIVEETAISFELEPPDEAEILRRMAPDRSILFLVCELAGAFAGYAYATPFRPRPAYRFTVESTVYVAPGHHGRGVARALYTSLFSCLRLLGYSKVVAGITLPNAASTALHESLGFCRVGRLERVGFKHGSWHDVEWWALELATPSQLASTDPPPEPRTPEELIGTTSWQEALPDRRRGDAPKSQSEAG